MTLAIPKLVVLDSATLGKVSRDYWDQDACSRAKARSFITRLKNLGVFVTFTLIHVTELLRHDNEHVVRDRLKFLQSIPLIAWLRPYDQRWFPGGPQDLHCRELHVAVHGSARNWQKIVNEVRPELWETGMGSEMFVENDEFWSIIKRESSRQHEIEKYVASVARTDPGHIRDMKSGDALRLPIRPKEKRDAYMRQFAQEMQRQLERHGDKRFDCPYEAAIDFANKITQNIKAIDEKEGNPIQNMLDSRDVPVEFVPPDMTIGEIGDLAVYAKHLKILSTMLRPKVDLTIKDVPPDTLPSYVLTRKLSSIQRKAKRISGSDLGDAFLSPLIFYADGIEVDKRTYEYLNQVRRNEPRLASLMGRFFRSSDYSQIPDLFNE